MERFAQRTAIVTGAGSGIGWEIASGLAQEGANVFGLDVTDSDGPPGVTMIRVDIAEASEVEAAIERAFAETSRLDILCNNAGIGSTTDAASCTVEEWDRVFAVNARGVFLGTKFAIPRMLDSGGGVIVNTASVAGLVGLKDRAAYCASKGAVISFTKQVAVQYAGAGIRCNCVCPGTIDSPWVGGLMAGAADPDATRAALIARQPLGRLGRPEEVAKAVLYLASDDAEFVTGAAWVIDGGLVAG